MHYFLHDNGGWMTVSGDTDVFGVVPDGYREVTEEEYNAAAGAITVTLPEEPPAEEKSAMVAAATAAPADTKRREAK